jgi:hypothetical protein
MLDPEAIEVGQGAAVDLLMTFSKNMASVSGEVEAPPDKNDEPGRAVLIPMELVMEGAAGEFDRANRWETLDQSRHFSDGNVRPGKYLAFGVEGADYELWSNADFVKALRTEGTELELQEKGNGSLHLKLIPKAEIEEVRKRFGL